MIPECVRKADKVRMTEDRDLLEAALTDNCFNVRVTAAARTVNMSESAFQNHYPQTFEWMQNADHTSSNYREALKVSITSEAESNSNNKTFLN